MLLRLFSTLMLVAALSACAPLMKNAPIMPEETTDGLAGDEFSALDEMPEASSFNPCNVIAEDGEFLAIYLMKKDPQFIFDSACKDSSAGCPPFKTGRDWPQRVRDQLRQDGCNDGLITQKLPEILNSHCRLGIYKSCGE